MQLTNDNYHSPEANRQYMSWHQYLGFVDCPAKQMAMLSGAWKSEPSEAMIVGSYTHCALLEPEKLATLTERNRDTLLTAKGLKTAAAKAADAMIDRLRTIPEVLAFVAAGHPERIITTEMFGVPWRAQMDLVVPGRGENPPMIFDLKTAKDFAPTWRENKVTGKNERVPWYSNYVGQMAAYQMIHTLALDAVPTCMIIGVTKQTPADVAFVVMDDQDMEQTLAKVEDDMTWIARVKAGIDKPMACEKNECDYCRSRRGWNPVKAEKTTYRKEF
jgi:hypothetical protein